MVSTALVNLSWRKRDGWFSTSQELWPLKSGFICGHGEYVAPRSLIVCPRLSPMTFTCDYCIQAGERWWRGGSSCVRLWRFVFAAAAVALLLLLLCYSVVVVVVVVSGFCWCWLSLNISESQPSTVRTSTGKLQRLVNDLILPHH